MQHASTVIRLSITSSKLSLGIHPSSVQLAVEPPQADLSLYAPSLYSAHAGGPYLQQSRQDLLSSHEAPIGEMRAFDHDRVEPYRSLFGYYMYVAGKP